MNDASAATKWVIRDLTLDFENGLVIRAGKPITVRHKLFELLAFFARIQNRVVSKDELVLAIWRGAAITDDALTQTISQARRCIGDDKRKIIRTIPKRGFLFASYKPFEFAEEGTSHYDVQEKPAARLIAPTEESFDPGAVRLPIESHEREHDEPNSVVVKPNQNALQDVAPPARVETARNRPAGASCPI